MSTIDLRYYSVIYNLIDEVKAAMSGMLSPELKQQIIGLAEVRDVFKSPKFGAIAGCMVTEGVVKRHNPIDLVITSTGECQTTISNAISLGKSNQRLNYAAQLFRFRQSRLDDFMTNQ